MKYKHVLAAFAAELWAVDETKFRAMVELLAFQAEHGKFTAAEIEARIGKAREAEVASRKGSVGIIPVRGVIANRANMMSSFSGGTSSEQLAGAFQSALADDAIKAIVLDVDSPGGSVAGTDELSSLIHAARGSKPIVAQIDALAASAAYWIASAADEVVATPSAEVGSIGTIWSHQNVAKALKKEGVTHTIVRSSVSPHKNEAHPFAPLSDEAAADMQSRVDEAGHSFVKALARNRNSSQDKVRGSYGQGRMMGADAALSAGMVDRIGTMQDTLLRFGASRYPAPATPSTTRRAFAAEREKRALLLD